MGGGVGPCATLVCGFLACEAGPCNPLLATLPRRMLLCWEAGGWLAEFPRQVVAESRRAGSATILTRKAELMFVESEWRLRGAIALSTRSPGHRARRLCATYRSAGSID